MTKQSLFNESLLTLDIVKELFLYDPKSGALTWEKYRMHAAREGCVAGCMTPQGYRRIGFSVDGKRRYYLAHRIAWLYAYGAWPVGEIDHINGVKSDNRISNLRDVNNSENHRNAKKPINNSSGVVGVHWVGTRSKWQARIQDSDKKRVHLGVYADKFEAICARKSAETRYGYHQNHGRSV